MWTKIGRNGGGVQGPVGSLRGADEKSLKSKLIYNLCRYNVVINFSMDGNLHSEALWIGIIILLLGSFQSCQKIEFDTGGSVNLRFSTDTLTFDTVFTQVGSTTRYFKIYNQSDRFARVDEIKLGGESSPFRINVDGYQGPVIRDLEIPPKDSVYVFVEVTVDPDQPLSVSPFIIEENLEIRTGAESNTVLLNAWGQNANYIPSVKGARRQVLITCDMNTWTWDDPKPYVIYGVVVIDSCTLEIPAGTDVYVHGGSVFSQGQSYNDGVLFIGKNANLQVLGTPDNPVTFQSDRLEKDYQHRIAQWGRIQLGAESKDNVISHARLRHANIGVLVDSLAELNIDHTVIGYNGTASLAAFRGLVTGYNNVFHSAAGYNLRVDFGGVYRFDYCTFANVGFGEEAVGVSNYYCFKQENNQCVDAKASVLNLEIRNSILYSSQPDGLTMLDATEDPDFFRVSFKNSLIRIKDLLDKDRFPQFLSDHPTVTQYEFGDPLFHDTENYDFSLDSLSVARDLARPIPGISHDLIGNPRDPVSPDAGALEWQ